MQLSDKAELGSLDPRAVSEGMAIVTAVSAFTARRPLRFLRTIGRPSTQQLFHHLELDVSSSCNHGRGTASVGGVQAPLLHYAARSVWILVQKAAQGKDSSADGHGGCIPDGESAPSSCNTGIAPRRWHCFVNVAALSATQAESRGLSAAQHQQQRSQR